MKSYYSPDLFNLPIMEYKLNMIKENTEHDEGFECQRKSHMYFKYSKLYTTAAFVFYMGSSESKTTFHCLRIMCSLEMKLPKYLQVKTVKPTKDTVEPLTYMQ